MFVRERMSHPVITAYAETTMQEALDIMQREQIRRLPVVDRHGKMIGIVTERALFKASPSDATTLSIWEMKEAMRDITIEELMTREVTTIEEDTPLEEAARIMIDEDISGLPVVRGENLVGFITQWDIFKIFLEVLGAREPGLRVSTVIPKTPGTIFHVSKAVFDAGGDIRSMGLFMAETSDSGELIFKVDGLNKEVLTKTVEPVVDKILDVR